jgi:alpha-mannosidase
VADLAIYPHPGAWHEDAVLALAECFRHDLLAAPGTAQPGTPGTATRIVRGMEGHGLSVGGEGVVLSSLRRRGDWLELRLVCQHPEAVSATVAGGLVAARAADLLGRAGAELPVAGGVLRLELRPWEVRTVQLQREEP